MLTDHSRQDNSGVIENEELSGFLKDLLELVGICILSIVITIIIMIIIIKIMIIIIIITMNYQDNDLYTDSLMIIIQKKGINMFDMVKW